MNLFHRCSMFLPVTQALWVFATPVSATSFVYNSAQEIVDHADAIVVATVLSTKVHVEEDSTWTYYELSVEDVLKGKVEDSTVLLRFYGGKAPNGSIYYLAGSPTLAISEKYLLFLSGNGENGIPLINWDYGLFRFRQRPDTGETVLATSDGQALFGIIDGEWVGSNVKLPADPSFGGRRDESEPAIRILSGLDDAPSASVILEEVRQFVAKRKHSPTFQPGGLIQSVPLPRK